MLTENPPVPWCKYEAHSHLQISKRPLQTLALFLIS